MTNGAQCMESLGQGEASAVTRVLTATTFSPTLNNAAAAFWLAQASEVGLREEFVFGSFTNICQKLSNNLSINLFDNKSLNYTFLYSEQK